jgi:CO dehydrogenase maturation factor|tara:strand:- start:590 stop:1348 length:759 start_codon:yes stop_codon:yes gene_type:complete
MAKIIGFSGKGGTGKTTIGALFLKGLISYGEKGILLIDSDPNECLPAVLGIKDFVSISDVLKDYKGHTMNPVKFSEDFKSMLLMNEQEKYDILVMGRGESEGCYCLINHLLKSSFENNVLTGGFSYGYVLMDCEAGIEHISRKTSTAIDDLIIITDASKMGIDTIKRIKDVSSEVDSEVKNYYVVGNRIINQDIDERITKLSEELDMEYLGSIPYDPIVEDFNFGEESILTIPDSAPAYLKSKEILSKIISN